MSIQSVLWRTDTSPYSLYCGRLMCLHTVCIVAAERAMHTDKRSKAEDSNLMDCSVMFIG
jgi:hypothetical protein